MGKLKAKKRREKRKKVLKELPGLVSSLTENGFKVHRFFPPSGASDVLHHRINGRLDFWPTTKTWLDRKTYEKGKYEDLLSFALSFFKK